jgi:Arabinose efflux permease
MAGGILSLNLLLMSTSTAGAAIAAIAKSFPHEPIAKVQLIGSIPQLGQIIATAIFSYLAFKLTRKNLGLISVAIVGIAGIIPVFFNTSLNLILACMILLGFGTGIISNVGPVLIQENFDGEARASVMGWAVGANNVGMMLFTAIGGMIGGTNWRNLFWVYAISFLIFIIAFFLIPQDKKLSTSTKKENGEQGGVFATLKSLNGYSYVIYLVTFALSLAMMTFLSNQSIVLSQQGKGTAYTAIVTAIGNVGGIVTAIFLTYIRKLTKTDTIAWGFISFVLSFVCVAYSSNFITHILGNMFSGMGIVMVNATIPYELSILSNQKQFTIAISLNTLTSSIAGMFAPMILAAIKIPAGHSSFLFGAILSGVVALLLLFTQLGKRIEKISDNKNEVENKEIAE